MLASQFLSVVIDEVDGEQPQPVEIKQEEPESPSSNEIETSDDNICGDSNLIQDLEAICKLPKVLLAECTISLANPEDKLSSTNRQCRFDAYVTPVERPKPRLKPIPLARLQANWKEPDEDPLAGAPVQNIEDLLQGVEAVYSDDEEANGSNKDVYRKMRCRVCRRGFYSEGPAICRRCNSSQGKGQLATDEFIPRGFQCKVCGKVYSQRSVLKKHEVVHSGYRLRCKVCGIDFTQRSSLLRHCKRIHGLQSDSDIPTPLVPPDLRLTGKMMASTSTTKYVAGLADRLNALLSKREDSITLAVTKKPVQTIGPYSMDPHTVMTITPDVIIQTDQD
uniref:Zinc finger protein 582 n=1 Tax=Lygus hesperus TaxID=30085 RepID=A0A0A9Y7J7_LYGHE